MRPLRKSFVQDGRIQIASVAAFNAAGELLFGRRRDDGHFTLPGGHMEEGEAPDHAAVRELIEETGLKPISLDFLGSGPVTSRDNKELDVHCFRVSVEGKPTVLNDPDNECSEWRWVEVTHGLPDYILGNLSAVRNVTLQLLGLQEVETGEDLAKTTGTPRVQSWS